MAITHGSIYVLINTKSGTALNLSDGSTILGWEPHHGDTQKWELSNDNDHWVFRNVASGEYLGLADPAQDNTPVCAVKDPVEWDVLPDEENPSVYRILVPGTFLNIDIADYGNPDDGTRVAIWGKWQPGENQTWKFIERE
ncbi:hypothetical protein H0H92_010166 [Tricholoma furcatifolium]|nr:hypothetical protein H0H92_010166 [Tricholoma furcatifolium]